MRVLLDTQVVLWALRAEALPSEAIEFIRDTETDVLVSAVVPWEIAIKTGTGRLSLDESLEVVVQRIDSDLLARHVPIEFEHAVRVARLPMHHTDPFDRMLVAQAQVLGVPIVTADAQIARYDVDVIMAD